MNKKILSTLMIMLFALVPVNSALAIDLVEGVCEESMLSESVDLPTLELEENLENGTWDVTVKDVKGNIVMKNNGVIGSAEEIIINTYRSLTDARTIAGCSHIPCSQSQVLGGINHVISGGTCTMVRYKFYKCNCCGAILGMVPNSAIVVGTHPAH